MKKLLSGIAAVLFVFSASQSMAQARIGLKAGLNASNMMYNYEDSDLEPDSKMKLGFHIGAIVDLEVSDALGIQTGLMFNQKGVSYDLEESLGSGQSVEGYDRTTLNYLEIPIMAAVKLESFQLYAGPYLAYGIGGKNSYDFTISTQGASDVTEKDDIKLKGKMGEVDPADLETDEGAFNALDYGINAGVGFQTGPILINAGYSMGFGNVSPEYKGGFDPADFKASNSVVSLSVSFFFGD